MAAPGRADARTDARGPEPSVAVVGGGWAGLAAAVTAADAGARVTLFEAAPRLGGRARTVDWRVRTTAGDERTIAIDNGQHLLVGAYRETLALIRRLGGDPDTLFARRPFSIDSDAGLRLRAPRWPAPWHLAGALLGARGLDWADRLAIARLHATLQLRGWRVDPAITVARLLDDTAQTAGARQRLWEPLCVGALNTPPERACAATFAAVLRDSLGGTARASDLLVPRVPLGDTLPALAAGALGRAGARLRLRTPVRTIAQADGGPVVEGERFDAAIVALPAGTARALLGDPVPPLPMAPIVTIWWLLDPDALPAGEQRLLEGGPGQWLFTRTLDDGCVLASVVVSADGPHRAIGRDALDAACRAQVAALARRSGRPGLPPPRASLVIDEKRATFDCTPGLRRPDVDALLASHPGVMLAGDWTASEYPATLESAVRSGIRAAHRLLAIAGGPSDATVTQRAGIAPPRSGEGAVVAAPTLATVAGDLRAAS